MRIELGRYAWFGAFVGIVMLGTTVTAAPRKVRVVTGKISDIHGKGIAKATIKVVSGTKKRLPRAVSKPKGQFRLAQVPPGVVRIEVSADGYQTNRIRLPKGRAPMVVRILLASDAPEREPEVASEAETEPAEAEPVATTRTVTGRVVDVKTSEPVIGAILSSREGDVAGFSEAGGRFVLEDVPNNADLVLNVEGVGFAPKTTVVSAGVDTIRIVVEGVEEEDAEGEVIAITGREPVLNKRNLANGASVVNDKELNRVSAPTLETALQGKVAGANIQTNSGAPGGGAQIRLRGVATINGRSTPLIVVDGVIISNSENNNGIGSGTATNRLGDLNPNDIENVEILKGASAGALYGSKAANGVIIITTKRGNAGPPKVDVTQRFGVAQQSRKLGFRTFNSVEEVMETFPDNQGAIDSFMAAGGQTFDFEDQLNRVAYARETLGSVSGGSKNSRYFSSFLVLDQPGIYNQSFNRKQSGRVTIGYDITKDLSIDLSGNMVHSTRDLGITTNNAPSYYFGLAATPSFVDLRKRPNGEYPVNDFNTSNLLQTQELLQNDEEVWRGLFSGSVSYNLWSNARHQISLSSTSGLDRTLVENRILLPPTLQAQGQRPLKGSIDNTVDNGINFNTGLRAVWSYQPESGWLRSAFTAGFIHEVASRKEKNTFSEGLIGAEKPNAGNALENTVTENQSRTNEQGIFLREELAFFDDRLAVTGGLLLERSSLNGDASQLFTYPSASLMYTVPVPEEYLETMRLRASFGQTGNRPLFGTKFTALSVESTLDNLPATRVAGTLGTSDVIPETVQEIEVGMDILGYDEKFVVEISGYQRNTTKLLLDPPTAPSTGFDASTVNAGELRGRGVELGVHVRPLEILPGIDNPLPSLTWTSKANLALDRTRVISLRDDILPFTTGSSFGTSFGVYRTEVGKSLTRMVMQIGDSEELVEVGNGQPDFRVGFSNVFQWGNLTLSSLIDWQQGSEIINLSKYLIDSNGLSPDFTTAGRERIAQFEAGDGRAYIEDGSFVKLREVSISYPYSRFTFGLSGRNLLVLTKYTGYDPEVSAFSNSNISRNFDLGPYAPSRTVWFSVGAKY